MQKRLPNKSSHRYWSGTLSCFCDVCRCLHDPTCFAKRDMPLLTFLQGFIMTHNETDFRPMRSHCCQIAKTNDTRLFHIQDKSWPRPHLSIINIALIIIIVAWFLFMVCLYWFLGLAGYWIWQIVFQVFPFFLGKWAYHKKKKKASKLFFLNYLKIHILQYQDWSVSYDKTAFPPTFLSLIKTMSFYLL